MLASAPPPEPLPTGVDSAQLELPGEADAGTPPARVRIAGGDPTARITSRAEARAAIRYLGLHTIPVRLVASLDSIDGLSLLCKEPGLFVSPLMLCRPVIEAAVTVNGMLSPDSLDERLLACYTIKESNRYPTSLGKKPVEVSGDGHTVTVNPGMTPRARSLDPSMGWIWVLSSGAVHPAPWFVGDELHTLQRGHGRGAQVATAVQGALTALRIISDTIASYTEFAPATLGERNRERIQRIATAAGAGLAEVPGIWSPTLGNADRL